jgi:hypothetical protein
VLVDESKGVYVKVEMSRRVHWKAFRCFPSLREPIAFDDTEKYDGHIMLDPTRLSICGKVKRRGLRTEAVSWYHVCGFPLLSYLRLAPIDSI